MISVACCPRCGCTTKSINRRLLLVWYKAKRKEFKTTGFIAGIEGRRQSRWFKELLQTLVQLWGTESLVWSIISVNRGHFMMVWFLNINTEGVWQYIEHFIKRDFINAYICFNTGRCCLKMFTLVIHKKINRCETRIMNVLCCSAIFVQIDCKVFFWLVKLSFFLINLRL